MTDTTSQLVVDRVDVLPTRPQWILVTGELSGPPLHIGDTITIQHHGHTTTQIQSIEIHSPPGKTTIMLNADLHHIVTAGTILSREPRNTA